MSIVDSLKITISSSPVTTHCLPLTLGTKFRYIIHGIPKYKLYTLEEARWSDDRQQFISELTHTLQSSQVKKWLGYIPAAVGDIKTTMWLHFPHNVFRPDSTQSPMLMWLADNKVFIPNSIEKMRHFPKGDSCVEQVANISPTGIDSMEKLQI